MSNILRVMCLFEMYQQNVTVDIFSPETLDISDNGRSLFSPDILPSHHLTCYTLSVDQSSEDGRGYMIDRAVGCLDHFLATRPLGAVFVYPL